MSVNILVQRKNTKTSDANNQHKNQSAGTFYLKYSVCKLRVLLS